MAYYDEIEIEDLEYDPEVETYYFPCPCGDRFQITRQALKEGDDVARCPSCSLIIKIIYSPEQFEDEDKDKKADMKPVDTAPTAPAPIEAF